MLECYVVCNDETLLKSNGDDDGLVIVPMSSAQRSAALMALSQALLLLAETQLSDAEIEEIKRGAVDGEPLRRRGALSLVHDGRGDE